MNIRSKRLVKGINLSDKVGNFAMHPNKSKKERFYHIMKYAHANVVLNENLGKF